mmetsp:Transcript_15012/g.34191  ORF Transcript_15012/g.34191 Transcript_15012/m.34191 type:complete len:261 (-) Transcript_15012:46-828(-)
MMQSFAVAAICLLVGRSQAARNSELVQTTLGDATEPARIHGLASDDDDAKCEAVVKGSKASRLGSVLGGLKDCACVDASQIVASQIGNIAYSYTVEDTGYSSFVYEKIPADTYHCMSKTEQGFRSAKFAIEKAVDFKKDHNSHFVFFGMKLLADALVDTGAAYGITPAANEEALKLAMAHIYQSEAVACELAQRGLEAVHTLADPAKFKEAVVLLLDTTQILYQSSSRDDAKDKAQELRMLMKSIAKDLLPKVSEKVPAW